MWIGLEPSARRMLEAPRHPEVNQENATALEPDNQIFATALECLDTLALELGRHLGGFVRARQPRIEDLDVLERAAHEHGLEPASNGFDLWQLGHAPSLATACSGQDLEDERALRWRLVGEFVRTEHHAHGLGGSALIAGVYLGEDLAGCDLVATLPAADDAHGVVDCIVLRAPARA